MPSIAPVIFFNIGWMTHYQGVSQTDPIQGGGRYVAETQSGGEIFNFKPYRKRLYGYVQASRSSSIRLERLGAAASDNSVDGVTVVWTASHPTNKGTYVVGWYQNATIFRSYGELARRSDDTITIHHASAELTDGFLLPPDARTLAVPRGKGGMGQSNVWYAEQNVAFVREVQTYIKSYGRSGNHQSWRGKKQVVPDSLIYLNAWLLSSRPSRLPGTIMLNLAIHSVPLSRKIRGGIWKL